MRKVLMVIFSMFLLCEIVHCKEIDYIYSDWEEKYPEEIEEIRIESQDRYRWFTIEDENRIETEEYYDYLEGYEKIEDSKKTFYRYIISDYIILNARGELVKDSEECRKEFCTRINLKPPSNEEEPDEDVVEEIVNPNTFDPIYIYYYVFMIGFLVLIIVNIGKIYLVMSNRWKY